MTELKTETVDVTRKNKRNPLEVGQRLWLEELTWVQEHAERDVREIEVVEVNKTSAYAVEVNNLEGYLKNPRQNKHLCYRINQRTHKVVETYGFSYILWQTREAFDNHVTTSITRQKLRKQVIEHVNKMDVALLQEVLRTIENQT